VCACACIYTYIRICPTTSMHPSTLALILLHVFSYSYILLVYMCQLNLCVQVGGLSHSTPQHAYNFSGSSDYMCVLILLYMCPHTTIFGWQVGGRGLGTARRTTIYLASSNSCICVLILLYMCPHTTIYVSSYYDICVLILRYMCPHTTIYVSS
jgi:hypothetical protein